MKHPPLDPDDLPADPDRDDVPPELLAAEGKRVTMTTPDGELVDGVLVVVPGLWRHARWLAGDDWPPPGPS